MFPKNYLITEKDAVPNGHKFIQDCAELNQKNSEFIDSFVMHLLEAVEMSCKSESKRVTHKGIGLDFFQVVQSLSPRIEYFFRSNLGVGPSKNCISTLNNKMDRCTLFKCDVKSIINNMKDAIGTRRITGIRSLFHMKIDATKVVKYIQINNKFKCIAGENGSIM